jgi:hypothetical protein
MTKQSINEQITVTSVGFRPNGDIIPRRMEYRGTSYTFIDAGIRYSIKQGGKLLRMFDVSDGTAAFRLRQDEDSWSLMTMTV